ncbi:MAG: hypothetical protein EP321_16175 [Sphingomonadales bacterium]|nr:MAG: hypothetical protein EP345_05505 [Sphingomonadales bacterium]TNF01688.1 MAG: hypothetical protein EP321_16175 [Sphingomonadales bacterium]
MAQPKSKVRAEEVIREDIGIRGSAKEPLRPITNTQGEVAAMQMLIASHFSGPAPGKASNGLEMRLEQFVSSVSRLSGYAFMGLAVIGLVSLFLKG